MGTSRWGAWGGTGAFARFDGSRQNGTFGVYGILDQTLWQPAGEPMGGRGVRTFLEYGGTQNDINAISQHAGGGITWTGAFAARPGDVMGFGPQFVHFGSQAELAHAYELALEAFYQVQLPHGAMVQPDLQYIVNPGGEHSNALVGTLRVVVTF